MKDLEKNWDLLIARLEKQFDYDITLKGVLYLIGLQELNMPEKSFSKEEKVDVLHIATCKILSSFGYYKFDGVDEDGNIRRVQIYPNKSKAMNLAFDVTPAKYITGLITEKGICEASEKGLKNLFK